MAYSTSNPPALVTQGIGNQGLATWHYTDDDATADVDGDGYITDGVALGMKVGDVVVHEDLSVGTTNNYRVEAVNADGSVNLGDGTVTGSTTDSD